MKEEYKRASWLELFYDVAFVALVAQLTYLAAEHYHTFTDLLNIFIVGYSIFIAWWATTANRNLQPSETAIDKLLVQMQMVGAFLMSITMSATFDGDYFGFFATLSFVRLLQACMLIRMYLKYPEKRPATYNILQGFLVGSFLWVWSAFLPAPYHFILASAALIVDILTPVTRGKGNTVRYLNVYHLQERLGLFLMLVIGESMIVVALSNTATSLRITEPAVLFSGLGLMVALWWMYFEHSDRHLGKRPNNLFLFLHAHGFLFGSLILLSVGYKKILQFDDTPGLIFMFLGAIGISVTIAAIRASLHEGYRRLVVLSGVIVFLLVDVLFIGLAQDKVIESVVGIAVLFAVIAFLDYRGFFLKIEKSF